MRSRNLVRMIAGWLNFRPPNQAEIQRRADADYLDRMAKGFSRVKPGNGLRSSPKARALWAEADKLREIADRLRAQ